MDQWIDGIPLTSFFFFAVFAIFMLSIFFPPPLSLFTLLSHHPTPRTLFRKSTHPSLYISRQSLVNALLEGG